MLILFIPAPSSQKPAPNNRGGNMKALLIIAPKAFQDIEYNGVKEVLVKNRIEVTTASIIYDCEGMSGVKMKADLLLKYIETINYDVIVVIGGQGAMNLGSYPEFNTIINTAYDNQQLVAAICISPMLLAKIGLLTGKKATVFPASEAIKVFKDNNVHYMHQDVVVDGRIITANGPEASKKFGEEIVKMLKSK